MIEQIKTHCVYDMLKDRINAKKLEFKLAAYPDVYAHMRDWTHKHICFRYYNEINPSIPFISLYLFMMESASSITSLTVILMYFPFADSF